ncbi:DVU0524 family FlgM-associated protein [Desulfoplanes sp.]
MITHAYMLKNMMRSYDRQIGNGQRIERIKKYISPLTGEERGGGASDQSRRSRLVQQISKEILDNLLGSGSTNPIVQEIKTELDREFPIELIFSFGPQDKEVQIIRRLKEGTVTLSDEEKALVLARAQEIIQEKVGRTMICP